MPAKRFMLLKLMALCWCLSPLYGQKAEISRFVPGPERHYVDLFNPSSSQSLDLGGYLLVTREYLVQLPPQTTISPLSALQFAYNANPGEAVVRVEKLPLYEKRQLTGAETGNFVLLQNPSGRIEDAFYFNREASVSFLPAREFFLEGQEEERKISIPDEQYQAWEYVQMEPDPAMAFVRINGRWRINSRSKNLIPATQYRSLQARFVEGIVTIKWNTTRENDCFQHVVERSNDGGTYQEIGSLEGAGNSIATRSYIHYDPNVEKNRVYYYRIKNQDKFGQIVYSSEVKIRTEENPGGFSLEISWDEGNVGSGLSVRFSSSQKQKVQVRILDEAFREMALLYYGEIEAGRQNLLTYSEELPVGKYFVIFSTEEKRYYEAFIVD
jgi:hypothetical protein